MKVLHVTTSLSVGGAERFLHSLCSVLSRSCETRMVCLTGPGHFGAKLENLGIPVTYLDMNANYPSLSAIITLRKLIRAFAPDIVQGWMYHGNLMATIATARAPSKPKLLWNIRHSLYDISSEKRKTQWVIRANRWLSGWPDQIIYNSQLARDQHERFGFNRATGQVIANGFDTDIWRPNAAIRSQVRNTLGLRNNDALVGYVARYHPMKDVPAFLQAMSHVFANNPRIHCAMVGRDIGPDNVALAPYYSNLPMQRVHILGEMEGITQIMPSFDALCLSSSRGEGFPNVLGEAMACGVPCVCTDVGDSSDIVADTGIVVPRSDFRELSDALLSMFSETEKQRQARGNAARQRIVESFGLPSIAGKYLGLYQALSAAKKQ